MYRVGFGDCFLLSLPRDADEPAHVLIDCGVHARGDIGMMDKIVADVKAECDGRLALVIATHAHQDHISGFARQKEAFKPFTVDEVWLPWTEDPTDKTARKLKQKHVALAQSLDAHYRAMNITAATANAAQAEALDAVMNAAPNQEALKLLKSGFGRGKVRYFKAGEVLSDAAGIKGLTVKVLGPPTDETFLGRMDPPSGDRFLTRNAAGAAVPANEIKPFLSRWMAGEAAYDPDARLEAGEKKRLREMVEDAAGLAFALDQAINNTSLVTLFTYRGRNLLFPGDAQYGNWQNWVQAPGGEAILESVNFFKVAHHGSYNATPKSALEKMTDKGFAAMISTQSKPWPTIPFEKMLKRLNEKATGVVRSDSIEVEGARNAVEGPEIELTPGFSVGSFWCDYTLTV
jgi:beta-lactamase superfamily II metal-dependent hydrolase